MVLFKGVAVSRTHRVVISVHGGEAGAAEECDCPRRALS